MSIRMMTWALDHAPVADTTQLLVLLCLADWADDSGRCWPSIERIHTRARCSESTARRAIRNLEKAGVVVRERPSTGYRSNHYRIITTSKPGQNDTLPNLTAFSQPSPATTGVINTVNLTPGQSDGVDPGTLSPTTENPGVDDTQTLSPMTPKPSMNHQEPPAAAAAWASYPTETAATIESHTAHRIAELESAIRAAGLSARFDRINDAQRATIDALVLAHGVPALVRISLSQHRPDNPARFATAWIQSWLAMPAPQPVAAPRPACDRCDNGWLPDDDDGNPVPCPTCRPNLARRTS